MLTGVSDRGDGGTTSCTPAEPSRKNLITLQDIKFTYPSGGVALGGMSLDLRRGEILSIVGPSGCGKSTLFSILAGLARPTSGKVIWHLPGGKPGRLNLVFQKDTNLPWLSVEQNIAFGLRYLNLTKAEKNARVHDLLGIARIRDIASRKPGQLSGGQRRRVALLMGVAPLPDVLLLDEPFSALDEATRIDVHEDVYRIVRETGISTALVTHDISEAISLSDRVILMKASPGRVERILDIPFGVDRKIESLREDAVFQNLCGDLWRDLRLQTKEQRS